VEDEIKRRRAMVVEVLEGEGLEERNCEGGSCAPRECSWRAKGLPNCRCGRCLVAMTGWCEGVRVGREELVHVRRGKMLRGTSATCFWGAIVTRTMARSFRRN
jgi:hypothetical protein